MIKVIKKICFTLILTVLLSSNLTYAKVELYHDENGKYNLDDTFVRTGNGPEYILNGKLLILGDSYGFLLCDNVDDALNYIVHPGYNVSKIKNEFINKIEDGAYSYVYLCIGPNDFMEQTDLNSFMNDVNDIVSTLESKSTKIIFSTYWNPNYSTGIGAQTVGFEFKCDQYDDIVKGIALNRGLMYIDTRDLLEAGGWDELDGVHPNKCVYSPLLYKILDEIVIDLDKSNFGPAMQ